MNIPASAIVPFEPHGIPVLRFTDHSFMDGTLRQLAESLTMGGFPSAYIAKALEDSAVVLGADDAWCTYQFIADVDVPHEDRDIERIFTLRLVLPHDENRTIRLTGVAR